MQTQLDQKFLEFDLVNLRSSCPQLIIDMPYAKTDNFIKKQVYSKPHAYLLAAAASGLQGVIQSLENKGFKLVLWDAYRPFSVQEIFWQNCPDENFLSQPVRSGGKLTSGSNHSKGAAVDVTLADSAGDYLDMPSGFDEFSERAHSHLKLASAKQRDHALILKEAMENNGFKGIKYEWWHFNWHESTDLPFIDIAL